MCIDRKLGVGRPLICGHTELLVPTHSAPVLTLTGLTTVGRQFASRTLKQSSSLGAAVGALFIFTDLGFLLCVFQFIGSSYGGLIWLNKWLLASCLVALFPIIGLACLAAVVSLLAAGAGEEGDVGDTEVAQREAMVDTLGRARGQ